VKHLKVAARIVEVEKDETDCFWVRVAVDAPQDCERIEFAADDLGPRAYAPPLIIPKAGINNVWLCSWESCPPKVDSNVTAECFISGAHTSSLKERVRDWTQWLRWQKYGFLSNWRLRR